MKCFNGFSFSQRTHFTALILSALASLLLSGCFKPQAHVVDPEDASATFYAETVKLDGASQVSQMVKGFSIPSERTYSLAVCVKNKRTGEKLTGHRFSLSGGARALDLQSDNEGCLHWSETIGFSFISQEKYIPFHRVLTAVGIHSGSRELQFAIDPWNVSGKETELVDLIRAKVPEENLASVSESQGLLKGFALGNEPVVRQLWPKKNIELESASLAGTQGGLGRMITFKIATGVLLYDLQNRANVYELTSANLTLEAALIAQTNVAGTKEQFKIWQSQQPVSLVREGDQFRAQFPVDFSAASASGSVLLAVRVKPVGAPSNLAPFEGLFEIGDTAKFVSNGAPGAILKASNGDGKFAFESYVRELRSLGADQQVVKSETKDSAQPGATAKEGGSNLPSGLSRMKAFKLTVEKPIYLGAVDDDETTHKTIRYSAKVCIADNSNGGKPAADVWFTIVKPDGTTLRKRTLSDARSAGCLAWEDSVRFKTFAPEKIYVLPFKIQHESGFEETVQIAFNPWSPWSFSYDMNEAADFVRSINNREPIKTRLLADRFGFDTVDYRDYEVDEFLTLKTVKRVRLRVDLRIQRDNSIRNGKDTSPEALRTGVYVLKAAIQTEFKDPSGKVVELISPMRGGSHLVRVRGGELKHDADFAIVDARLMKSRANLIFEVLPVDMNQLTADEKATLRTSRTSLDEVIDRDSELVTPTFVGPLWIRDESGGSALLPTDDLLADPSGSRLAGDRTKEQVREALRPLANMTVDQVLARMKTHEQEYRARMRAMGSLAGVLKSANLEYVPIQNESVILSRDARLATNNRALPQQGALGQLLKFLNFQFPKRGRLFGPQYQNFPLKEAVTAQTLTDLVEGRREIDSTMAARLCLLFMIEMPRKLSPDGQFTFSKEQTDFFGDDCIKRLGGTIAGYGQQPLSDLFTIERKLRVFETSQIEFSGGRAVGMTVGTDVSFGRNNQESITDTFSFSPTKILENLGKIPGLGFLNIPSSLGISAYRNHAWSHSQSIQEGSSFRSGAELAMEQSELKMVFKRYETCAVIRANPKFWDENLANLRYTNPRLTPEQKLEIMGRGIMLCSGVESKKPVAVKERYFSFAQGHFDQTLLDSGDLRNQPWLLTLRGMRDYVRFVSLLEAKKAAASDVNETITSGLLPLERLEKAYESALPTLPGLYTIDPNVGLPRPVTP